MNKIYNITLFIGLMFFLGGCQEEEPTLDTLLVPSNLEVASTVRDDQSGNVSVTPSAENVLSFQVFFNAGDDPVSIGPGETANFRYTTSGQYQAPVTVVAYGAGGISSSTTIFLDMDVRLFISPETLQQIAGDGSKRWVWNQTEAGHFGVGPLTNFFPEFFSAGPNSLNDCLYDDVLVFSYDENDNYSYQLLPGTDNLSFINWTDVNRFFPDATPQEFNDECRDITGQVPFQTSFSILDNEDGSRTLDVGNSFVSYFSVVPGQYQIVELTADKLVLRGISQPFNGDAPLAWYSTFVPEDAGTGETEALDLNFDTLAWSDEFDVDGAPDPTFWSYDLGTGNNGWGNNESQFYTDRPENIIVENGVLKITARKEDFNGSPYTSSRIQTYEKFDFTYGRVEARAKLPTGGGTWPAIWTLGADFETNQWPAAGEIDIMEHVGNQQDKIFGTTHDPSAFGGNARSVETTVTGVSDDFHIYAMEWTPTEIRFYVDDNIYGSLPNDPSRPFDKDFFFIMNVAMGGNFGGEIDAAFTESSMEVDYIRLYQ